MAYVSKTIVASIINSFKGEAQAVAKARTAQDKEINKALDAMILANDKPTRAEFAKGNSTKNPARAEVNEIFGALVEAKFISANTARQYAQCFWIAFETDVPFSRTLANDKKATNETKGTSTPKSGKVTSTSRTDLDKTLSKALAQARNLGLSEFAATLLDHCIESLADFKETVLDK
jgi:hypothetical protein